MKKSENKLKRAFTDAALREARLSAEQYPDIEMSDEHLAAMQRILDGKHVSPPRRRMSRRAVIILVAALVALLSSCAAMVYHFAGAGLSVRVMTDYHEIIATAPEGSPQFIEKERLPSFIPKEYKLTTEINSVALISRIYHNGEGEYLEFVQSTMSSISKTENNQGVFDVITIAGREILRYRSEKNGYIYRFADEYNFYMHSSIELSNATLKAIIGSIP